MLWELSLHGADHGSSLRANIAGITLLWIILRLGCTLSRISGRGPNAQVEETLKTLPSGGSGRTDFQQAYGTARKLVPVLKKTSFAGAEARLFKQLLWHE